VGHLLGRGESYRSLARQVCDSSGVDGAVSHETVRQWCRAGGLPTRPRATTPDMAPVIVQAVTAARARWDASINARQPVTALEMVAARLARCKAIGGALAAGATYKQIGRRARRVRTPGPSDRRFAVRISGGF
jgi:hypothetical protein